MGCSSSDRNTETRGKTDHGDGRKERVTQSPWRVPAAILRKVSRVGGGYIGKRKREVKEDEEGF